ncbi:hypothetical protein [Bdellovibrio reynosensis]|uniref:Uncharacterized protein n=1 Tax=Bdellovibrio reynosensis TaxID=2835041 RepID=A0ABY4CG08_9BACT|nr:hypothetical protein [Bdellovibrio reynosensis]UOF02726.1 hypothetical protein MNR06_07155 [Bdellovibrio reynosensis]
MKKFIVAALVSFMSVSAFAQDTHLVCMTGHEFDMDIYLDNSGSTESITVKLSDMGENVIAKLTNSSVAKGTLAKKEITAVISSSDLAESSGGTYTNASIINIAKRNDGGFDVRFSRNNSVLVTTCSQQ